VLFFLLRSLFDVAGAFGFLLQSLPRSWFLLHFLFPAAIATAGLTCDYIFYFH
jgi:hypothetical protein